MTEQRPPYPPEPEHRPSPFEGLTARRVFEMVKTPITLFVLLAIVLFGGWWGMTMLKADDLGPAPVPCQSQDVGAALKSEKVTVKVHNGGTKRGLAKTVSTQLKAAGFFIEAPENTKDRVGVTVIKGSHPNDPEVKLVAGFFPGAKVEGDNRSDHLVNVYVGNRYQDLKTDAPREIPVKGPVCLPPIVLATASPSPSPEASK